MCMARLNVYVPDELAARGRAAGLNVSALTQQAMAAALAGRQTDAWIATLRPARSTVGLDDVLEALDEARDGFGVVDR